MHYLLHKLSTLFFLFPLFACNDKSAEGEIRKGESQETVGLIDDRVAEIAIDNSGKCNLPRGYYYLKSPITDSTELADIVRTLAIRLLARVPVDKSCDYPIMSSAFIYIDTVTYRKYDGDYLAMCNLSPTRPGHVYVNTYKLKSDKN